MIRKFFQNNCMKANSYFTKYNRNNKINDKLKVIGIIMMSSIISGNILYKNID